MLRHLLPWLRFLPLLWGGFFGDPVFAQREGREGREGPEPQSVAARPAEPAAAATAEHAKEAAGAQSAAPARQDAGAAQPAATAQQKPLPAPAPSVPAARESAKSAKQPAAARAAQPRRPAREPHFAEAEADVRFAAMDTDVFVRASATESPVRWGQLVYKDGQLIFGSHRSTGSIIWETALDLGEYMMNSIYLVAGASEAERASVLMQREIIGRHDLQLRGDGRMDLATANNRFTGALKIDGAELRLREAATLHKPASVQVSAGGHFVIDNTDLGHVMNNRFRGGDIALSGGSFRYLTRDNAAAIEHIGTLTARAGANRFEVSGGGAGQLGTTISIGHLRFGPSGSLNFSTSGGADFSGRTTVKFQQRPQLLHGVIARTTVNGRDWATVDQHNRLRAYAGYQTGSEKTWGPAVNAAPAANQRLTADRELASLKLSGEGLGGTDEDKNPLGRIIDLGDHTLTLNGAGILATGDDYRHEILGGTIRTTRENFEIHVSGSGGLSIENSVLANGASGATGLIKTGDGELMLNSPKIPPKPPHPTVKDNTFAGAVYVNQGKLTLFRKRANVANIPGTSIYVGAGQGDAILSVKGGSEQINNKATVTLRGGPKGEAIFQLDRVQPPRGPRETFHKLKVEGSGVIEFKDSHIGTAPIDDNTKSILYINELEIDGELFVRGWDTYNTHILLNTTVKPSDELLSRIHFEKMGKVYTEQFTYERKTYWEIKAEFIYPDDPEYPPYPDAPEPASYGGILGACAIAFFLWRRRAFCKAKSARAPTHTPAASPTG
ncbi:hypothetical protein AXK11_02980 [Cephaloticoccus primus]|uniref:Uncharacterized protein n=1 Tax=Cephaloticoccus primus TaxID=1548207 RepID=A0A139SR41_9BACT|nr:hypothetical protein [Cephaloticoccus primus]KXU37075.1 hypothetical protein AXK11_02980 [Cephaloticoccus primus]